MKRQHKDTHIYFPPKVYEQIKKLAKENRRTVSAEIVMAVEGHLAAAQSKEKR
jgi:predicted DNA-binding protein